MALLMSNCVLFPTPAGSQLILLILMLLLLAPTIHTLRIARSWPEYSVVLSCGNLMAVSPTQATLGSAFSPTTHSPTWSSKCWPSLWSTTMQFWTPADAPRCTAVSTTWAASNGLRSSPSISWRRNSFRRASRTAFFRVATTTSSLTKTSGRRLKSMDRTSWMSCELGITMAALASFSKTNGSLRTTPRALPSQIGAPIACNRV